MELQLVITQCDVNLTQCHMHSRCFTGSGDEADYTPVVAQAFSFTNSDRNRDLSIDIVSDTFTEYNETFSAMLDSVFLATQANGPQLVLSIQESARLILDPDTASVTILDDDGMYFIGSSKCC